MSLRALAVTLLAALAAGAAARAVAGPPTAAPVAEPRYVVEPCCDLCPRAGNRASYNTKFLESFATLTQGKDGWLFRSDDLRTQFGPAELPLRSRLRMREDRRPVVRQYSR